MEINMNGDQSDPFYRYKMPSVKIIVQKHKTIFTNVDSILACINRDIKMFSGFLNKQFATSWTYKNNSLETSKTISQSDLQDAILKFISVHVLCPVCKNPETEIIVDKKNKIVKCRACSYTSK